MSRGSMRCRSASTLLVLLLLHLMSMSSVLPSPTAKAVMARIRQRCNYTEQELESIENKMIAFEETGGASSSRGADWRDQARRDTSARCNYTDAEVARMYAQAPAPAPSTAS